MIALLETVPELRDRNICQVIGQPTKGIEITTTKKFVRTFTISLWCVCKTINLVEVVADELYDFEALRAYKGNFLYENYFSQYPDYRNETMRFMKNLSRQFTKYVDTNEDPIGSSYIFSANASNILINNGFDGVIYPSVKGNGVGINVAIKPEVIDTGAIQFVGSFNVDVVRDGNKLMIY